jgi:hypothetical protein
MPRQPFSSIARLEASVTSSACRGVTEPSPCGNTAAISLSVWFCIVISIVFSLNIKKTAWLAVFSVFSFSYERTEQTAN